MPWRLAPRTCIVIQGDSDPDTAVPGSQRAWARAPIFGQTNKGG